MSHLASSTAAATAANSISPARPAGAGAEHILIAAVWNNSPASGPVPMTGSAGWTRFRSRFHTAYVAAECSLFWALGDVAALTFSIPGGTSANLRALVSAFAGRNLTAPIGDVQDAESIAATITVPLLTMTLDDSDVLATWAEFQASLLGPITGGAPSGYTDRINDATDTDMHVIGSTRAAFAVGTNGPNARACGNFTAKLATGVVIMPAGAPPPAGGSVNTVIL
jgi:hypothetical protein